MKERPVGITILAMLYIILGIVALVIPFRSCPAWQAETIQLSFLSLAPGMVKVLCLLLAVGLFATAALFFKGMAPGLYLALVGLALAIILEFAGGTYLYGVIDLAQLGYIISAQDYFS